MNAGVNDSNTNEKEDTTTTSSHHVEKARSTKQKNPTKARLQELGPRFTLKLRWIQEVCYVLSYFSLNDIM